MRQAQPRGESSHRNMPAPNTQYTTKTRPQSARGRPIPGQAPAAKRDPISQGVPPACAALAVEAIFPHQRGSETLIFRAPPQAQTGSRWVRPSARRGFSAKPAPPDAPIAQNHRSAPSSRRSRASHPQTGRRIKKSMNKKMMGSRNQESRNQRLNGRREGIRNEEV